MGRRRGGQGRKVEMGVAAFTRAVLEELDLHLAH